MCVGSGGKPVWPLWPFSAADHKPWTTKGYEHQVSEVLATKTAQEEVIPVQAKKPYF
jgi:hypothetical protein